MAEFPRLKIVLLLIAVTQLATEVVRLALEWSPSRDLQGAIKKRMSGGHQDPQAWLPDAGQNGFAQGERRPAELSGERGPWLERREYVVLPYRPPTEYRPHRIERWCPECRRPMWRYEQWRDGRWYWRYEG